MSRLHCSTVREALWERAASAGPASLSPALAGHLAACPTCREEGAAVKDLLDLARGLPDPDPPGGIWDGFDEALGRRLAGERPWIAKWTGTRARRAGLLAATLVVGFALGALATRGDAPDEASREAARAALIADVEAELGNDARLESYVREIEELLVAYRAEEHGDAVDTFRRSLSSGMVAGPGAPDEADRRRIERQRVLREQMRALVLGMLVDEVESERRGFALIERRIANLAGRHLLYFVR